MVGIKTKEMRFKVAGKNQDYTTLLKLADGRRRLEIGLLWKRALLFWGFIAVAFVAYGYCLDHPLLGYKIAFLVSIFGFVTSLIWAMVNRGSKYWQEYWEKQCDMLLILAQEDIFDTMRGYKEYLKEGKIYNKSFWSLEADRYSPSKLIIALSDFVLFSWTLIMLGSFFLAMHILSLHIIFPTLAFFAVIFLLGYFLLYIPKIIYHPLDHITKELKIQDFDQIQSSALPQKTRK